MTAATQLLVQLVDNLRMNGVFDELHPEDRELLRQRMDAVKSESRHALAAMFEMQSRLNANCGAPSGIDYIPEDQQAYWLKQFSLAAVMELCEMVDSTPWKWWAKYQKFDAQNIKVEIVDIFHFVISLALVMGMSAEDVFEAYRKKNEVNLQRSLSGYTEKDPNDCKHI